MNEPPSVIVPVPPVRVLPLPTLNPGGLVVAPVPLLEPVRVQSAAPVDPASGGVAAVVVRGTPKVVLRSQDTGKTITFVAPFMEPHTETIGAGDGEDYSYPYSYLRYSQDTEAPKREFELPDLYLDRRYTEGRVAEHGDSPYRGPDPRRVIEELDGLCRIKKALRRRERLTVRFGATVLGSGDTYASLREVRVTGDLYDSYGAMVSAKLSLKFAVYGKGVS